MSNRSKFIPMALRVVALAAASLWSPMALAHGAAAKIAPLKTAAKEFNTALQWDGYANVFNLTRNSTTVRIKPGAKTALVNGTPMSLSGPLVMRKGMAFVPAPCPGAA